MFKLLKFLCILTIISATLFGSDYKEGDTLYVWARNGVNLRDTPSPTGKVIGLLLMGTKVIVKNQATKILYNYSFINKSNEGYECDDIILHGYWMKVEVDGVEGYVFSKLLLPMKVNESIENYLKIKFVAKKSNGKKEDEDGCEIVTYYSDKSGKNKSKMEYTYEEEGGYYYFETTEIRDLDFEELIVYYVNIFEIWNRIDYIYSYKENKDFKYAYDEVPNSVTLIQKSGYVAVTWEDGMP